VFAGFDLVPGMQVQELLPLHEQPAQASSGLPAAVPSLRGPAASTQRPATTSMPPPRGASLLPPRVPANAPLPPLPYAAERADCSSSPGSVGLCHSPGERPLEVKQHL